ncbi:MAG: hypothetical protein CM1200mP30_23960 [Pseudomonadota bacterium]|nr:MAG: hypothetical protein CM1200mP30_23960 [Pseudomonadota bacterium]
MQVKSYCHKEKRFSKREIMYEKLNKYTGVIGENMF